ncbi:MAG: hypothetical protein JJU03_07980 [Idiomarina sp.]|nr:hypothetical protein [Idiomarina sp.]
MTLTLITPLVFGLSACQPRDVQVSKNPFCQQPQNTNDQCSFALGEHQIWLSASDSGMPIEEGVQLILTSSAPLTQIQSEIRGVSMYMGRLPVIWEQGEDGLWRADIYLGACTDPQMVWELRLTATVLNHEAESAEQAHTLRVRFQSYIPGR